MPQSKGKQPSRKKKPQKFDASLKEWIEQQASDILPLLLPGTVYEETLNVEVSRSMMRADKVFRILYYGEEHILHLEFETGSDGDLRSRLLVYNSVLYRDHKVPVITIVIYPFPVEQAESPLYIKSNGDEILTFKFRTLPLFNLEAEQFVQAHRACMYPLLPTMNGVHAELIAQVMQELTDLYRDNKTSLSQQFTWMEIFLERTGTITSLEKVRIEERLKMFDQLWDESPRVQKMKKQFREEAQKEAKQEAEQELQRLQQEAEQELQRLQQEAEQELQRLRQEAEQEQQRLQQERQRLQQEAEREIAKQVQERQRLQQEAEQEIEKQVQERLRSQQKMERVMTDQEVKTRRSSLVSVTRARFPTLTDFAQQHVELFDKPEVLDLLIQQVAVAPDANIVRLLLSPGSAP